MGRYQSYTEYKSTHLGWLNKIPSHWEVKRLKYLGEAIIGLTYSPDDVVNEDEGVLVLRSSNIQNKLLSFEDNVFVSKNVPEKLLTQKGDILICARNGSRALIGKNALINERAAGVAFGAFMSIFRSSYNNYLSKVFNSPLFEYQSGSFLTATINQLTTSNLNNMEIPLPPESERKKIANFLDHETAKIDTLIEKQQQLIKLLKEKRQAVISHAVTKGLNPNAPMRDSGVEWLDEVPAHWKVVKLGQLAFMQEGPGLRTWQFKDSGTRVICVTNITEEGIDFLRLEKFISTEEYLESYQHFTVNTGDILLSSSGNSWGKVAKYEGVEKVILNTSTIRLNELQHKPLLLDYIQNFLLSEACREQLGIAMTGSCQPNFGPTHLKDVRTPIPPEDEQIAISEYLVKQMRKYDQPLQACELAIKLIQERRTALISAAVTGKIDVRNWQAPEQNPADKEVAA